DVIVGALLQASNLIDIAVLSGHQDDGDAHLFPQLAHYFQPRHLRHYYIQEHDVRPLLFSQAQCLISVAGCYHSEALSGKFQLHQPEDPGLVVDCQDEWLWRHRNSSSLDGGPSVRTWRVAGEYLAVVTGIISVATIDCMAARR